MDNKPRLEVLELPDQTAIQGPVQVHQRMTNNATVRSELTLLSNSNQAQVLYGNLISLPVGDGMLYVEPVYVKSSQENAVPLLQKVLMSYGDGGTYVVLADNLKDGLDELVAQGKSSQPTTVTPAGQHRQPADHRHRRPHAGADRPAGRRRRRRWTRPSRRSRPPSSPATSSGTARRCRRWTTAMTDFQNAQKAARRDAVHGGPVGDLVRRRRPVGADPDAQRLTWQRSGGPSGYRRAAAVWAGHGGSFCRCGPRCASLSKPTRGGAAR